MGLPAVVAYGKRGLLGFITFLLLLSPLFAQGPIVHGEVQHDVSKPLRELATTPPIVQATEPRQTDEMKVLPLPSGFKPANEPDLALQRTAAALPVELSPTAILNFEGIGSGFPAYQVNSIPPDTNGAVGLTQYVQWVNTDFAVFAKASGKVLNLFPGNTLWQGFGGGCESNNDGDPIVTYDKLADRWVFTQLAVSGLNPTLQCVAVSTTSDALGAYNRYAFAYTNFNNDPKLGVWPDAYYITFNMFSGSPASFAGAQACAYDRNAMLNGQPATQVCFPPDPNTFGLLPADMDGLNPPAAGSPNFMLSFDVNSLKLIKFHVDFANPANSTLSPATTIAVAPFTPALCSGGTSMSCVPQPPGDGTLLDSLGDRLMYRLAYRNFGDHESLVVNHSVIADPIMLNSGIRWYEIQNPNGTPTVVQQSTFAPDANFRWMGSAAMDISGDLAVGYNVSSTSIFPSIAFAGRAFNDPGSTLQAETTLISGAGSQTQSLTRWGDYSAMQVDPADDCTFWYTTEYLSQSGIFNWNTRIANFKFPNCGVPLLHIALSHSGNFTQNQTGATYTINIINGGAQPTDGTAVTVTDTLPTGLTATAAGGTGWICPTTTGSTVSCNRTDVLAAASSFPPITVTVNVDANAIALVTNTASVSGGGDKDPVHNTASDPTTITQTGPDLGITKFHNGPFIQGQTGSYVLNVANVGLSPTNGTTVTVTDNLPSGLTFNAASGTGWSCVAGPPVVCTSSDVVASNQPYPSINLKVNVAANAPAVVVNTASVAGGGDVNALNNNASDPTNVIPPPPVLSITKTHNGNFLQGQQNAQYTVIVKNASGAPTSGVVTVADSAPLGLTVSSASGLGWACVSNRCKRSDVLAVGNSYPPITVFVNVDPNAPASVFNVAMVSGGGTVNSSTVGDTTTISPAPVLSVTKTHVDPFSVGQIGTYTITVSNVGQGPTTGLVTVSDSLPPGMTTASISGTGWACSTSQVTCFRADALAAGSSYPAITLAVSVTGGGPSGTNTVNASGGGSFNTAIANDLTNIKAPVLAIAKTHVGDFTVGVPAVYTITVSNNGPGGTGGQVTVQDFLPSGMTATSVSGAGWLCNPLPTTLLTCSRSDILGTGGSYPALNVTARIDSATLTVVNTAQVTGGGDSNTHNISDTANVNAPVLAVTKTHNGNFVEGQTGIYTITVSNTGKLATAGAVTLQDSLPTGLTAAAVGGPGWNCSGGGSVVNCTRPDALAPAASYPAINLVVNVATGLDATVTNSVTVSGGGAGTGASASDTAKVSGPRLSIAKSHTGTFVFGQTGTYTINVSNTGALATSGTVTVQDLLPSGLTLNSIVGTGWNCSPASASCTRSDSLNPGGSYPAITATVAITTTGQVTNSASVTGGGDGGLHTANDATNISGTPPALAITKTHNGNFTVGQTGTYTITVANTGATATVGTVTVQDSPPSGLSVNNASGTGWSCSGTTSVSCARSDSLAAGSQYPPLLLTVNVNGGGPAVTNIATLSGGGDPNLHTANDLTNVLAPSLGISNSHSPDPLVVGSTGTYTITVDNKAGKAPTAGEVDVNDSLPSGLAATNATGAGWNCATNTQSISCHRFDPLAVGSSYPPITLTVNVTGGTPSLVNTASVSGGGDSQSHSAGDTANVSGPVLAITKTHTPEPIDAGLSATYTLTISNRGTGATVGPVTVTDNLPAGLTFTSSLTSASWMCSGFGTSVVNCTTASFVPPLNPGASFPPVSFIVTPGNTLPTFINTASVTGGGDLQTRTASDVATVKVAQLAITKTHSGDFTVGQPGTYTITVSNTGNRATTGQVTVNDNLPFGFNLTSAAGTNWNCFNIGDQIFLPCIRSDALAPGASYEPITLTVAVNGLINANTFTNTATVTGGGDGLTRSASDPTVIHTPALAIAESHSGTFTAGQTASYTITVSNLGTVATNGQVTVTDNLPSGLNAGTVSGTGWSCILLTVNFFSCSRTDALAGGTSYPPLMVNGTIDFNAQSPLLNQATVSGGSDPNSHTATDSASINFPDMAITLAHTGNFFSGEVDATYTITVSNAGVVPTAGGTVTVDDVLPIGLTATAASGSGWTCSIFTGPQTEMNCTRPAGTLSLGNSYPPITLTVQIALNAPSPVTNVALVFGIGESNFNNNTASDVANISPHRTETDFDGDGKTDLAAWRPSTGDWWVVRSSDGAIVHTHWGDQASGDIPVPGDYDGDGKTDLAVWRSSTGDWWIIRSSDGAVVHTHWGTSGDIPVPGDYDGDGKTDLAVWRPSTGDWWIIRSSDGTQVRRQWGDQTQGDIPVPGDYDGDGKNDFAVWRATTGTWFVVRSSDGTQITRQWGDQSQGDIPVPGDYDGDGKSDFAIWRKNTGTWFILRSSDDGQAIQQWGLSTDKPVLGDFDGNGKADFAVWRPSNGTWFVIRSSDGGQTIQQWGLSGDVPMKQPVGQLGAGPP